LELISFASNAPFASEKFFGRHQWTFRPFKSSLGSSKGLFERQAAEKSPQKIWGQTPNYFAQTTDAGLRRAVEGVGAALDASRTTDELFSAKFIFRGTHAERLKNGRLLTCPHERQHLLHTTVKKFSGG
jgi:hypothetical protein